jgi:hypothetical protein
VHWGLIAQNGRVRQESGDAHLVAGADLFAVEVAAASDHREVGGRKRRTGGLLRHVDQLAAVVADGISADAVTGHTRVC